MADDEDIEVLDLNKLDEDFDFLGRPRKSRR
jgi:hypothetical protein